MPDFPLKDGYVVLGIEEIWEDEELTEIKKVVIPKFVAEAMQGYDSLEMMLGEEYYSNSSEEIGNDDIQCWIDENFETLCRAWLDGYEVKKEKLYRVELPELGYLIKRSHTDYIFVNNEKLDNKRLTSKLTEQEIKSIDERYWAFAVEVEGEE
ncbi:DUF1642 domain-containing protein [Carnobacterium maltaromaticum]|uniref:DUF1642 domain-containing protein n=1 Tax=Carnobacterium maltaromaticum TaxID=2751 RepID=UPI0039C96133